MLALLGLLIVVMLRSAGAPAERSITTISSPSSASIVPVSRPEPPPPPPPQRRPSTSSPHPAARRKVNVRISANIRILPLQQQLRMPHNTPIGVRVNNHDFGMQSLEGVTLPRTVAVRRLQ